MADFNKVKKMVTDTIYSNDGELITGDILRDDLVAMIDETALASEENVDAITLKADKTYVDQKNKEQDVSIALKANKSQVDAKNKEQDAEIEKKLNKADAVGKKTDEGGITFYEGGAKEKAFNEGVRVSSRIGVNIISGSYRTVVFDSFPSAMEKNSLVAFEMKDGQRKIVLVTNVNPSKNSIELQYPDAEQVATGNKLIDFIYGVANGYGSHVEGYSNNVLGRNGHGEGDNTISTNDNEHSQGTYNKSNVGTIDSVGIGTSDGRRNATETMSDGKHYIFGLGDYDGTNPTETNDVVSVFNGLAASIGNINKVLDEINGEVI